MQNATVSAWCEERCYCRRVHVSRRETRRGKETRRQRELCRSHNVAFSTYTHTRANVRAKKTNGEVEYRHFGWHDKAKPRADEILRRTHEKRLKRNRSPSPSVTGLAPMFSTLLRFTAASANDILAARSRIVTDNVLSVERTSSK